MNVNRPIEGHEVVARYYADVNQHSRVFLENISQIQEYLRSIHFDKGIIEESEEYIRNNSDELFSPERGREKLAHLQKNLGSLLILIDMGYDFSTYEGGLNFYDIAHSVMTDVNEVSSTDSMVAFPKMVDDAIESLDTLGTQPPKEELQSAMDYFANSAYVAVSEVTGLEPSLEQTELYCAVEAARRRVGQKYNNDKLTPEQQEVKQRLYTRIDETMMMKVDERSRIMLLQDIGK